ncbi:histidine kinase [Taibaiella chishuiensis]|uniref:Histidine kinase n=2 Tax=Taibaiella chishuiensis TaxID=1434707 RepID=A0A2P8D350_9BACT|nr:histidine kinase [Taibaiella chishuiensis]
MNILYLLFNAGSGYGGSLRPMEKTKKDLFLNNTGKRVLFILFAFILTYIVSYIIDPYAPYWGTFFTRPAWEILEDVAFSVFTSAVISETSILTSRKLNKCIIWTEKPLKRLIVETTLNMLMVLLINLLLTFVYVHCADSDRAASVNSILSIEETKGMIHWIVVSAAIAFMIMGINTGDYLILNWKNAAIKAAEYNQAAMEAELQSLKLQIDPHFVFNNLSVLSELILEDQQLGYDYAENFTKIYRYMLVNSRKDVIPLEDELKFLDAYMFLIKHRIGDGVEFNISVSKDAKFLLLPPMTLQLLVENALKHNRTTKKDPLVIWIFNTDQHELVVKNTLMRIGKNIDSSGIGLKNIDRRYRLLSERQLKINDDGHCFTVTLPLLKV